MRLTERDIEALTDLLTSDGWGVFERMVRAIYSTDKMRADLQSLARTETDMAKIGSLALSKIQESATADYILALPRHYVRQTERQEAKRANETNK